MGLGLRLRLRPGLGLGLGLRLGLVLPTHMALRPESVQQNIALRRSHLVRGRVGVGVGVGTRVLGLG